VVLSKELGSLRVFRAIGASFALEFKLRVVSFLSTLIDNCREMMATFRRSTDGGRWQFSASWSTTQRFRSSDLEGHIHGHASMQKPIGVHTVLTCSLALVDC
jgi:hypothetical protein